ncbi:SDR family NAD(P)-dependent oxidoreductase [Catenulispora subtropica]|uniref:SDR family oxidoreductase n=1 Tax=Catenulispora subtropica TaxID=450798 RepID=A0ABN2RNA0_9ACTN
MSVHERLDGTVVAVTGAARGIGLATARRLALAGAAVALGDLDAERVKAAAEHVGTLTGSRTVGIPLDVTHRPWFAAFLDEAEDALGPLDVLVNNAGVMWVGPFAEESDEVAARQFDVNVFGVLHGMKLVVPRMRERGGGHVITIASAAARMSAPGAASYAGTKGAVYGYCAAVREELHRSGVHLSLVLPSVVDTPLAVGTARGVTRRLAPEQVAEAVFDVVLRPRFEVWVPGRIGMVWRLAGLLPERAQEALYRALVPNQLYADSLSRLAYESHAFRGDD